VDRHHLRVHRQWGVGMVAATGAFERHEVLRRTLTLLLLRLVLLLLKLLLQAGYGWSVEGALRDTAILQSAAIVTCAVVIVALANDLAAAHDDSAVAVVERRFGSLLEAQSEVVVGLHFGC